MQTMKAIQAAGEKPGFDKREFPMTDSDFTFIRRLAKEKTGIELGDHKKEMIYSRIVRRIRSLGLPSFRNYCEYLETHTDAELTNFVNAITTNLTAFFREPHHFEFLEKTVIPELKVNHKADKRIRIWSAGCSTGEEPYSLAMTLHKTFGSVTGWNTKVLATDLDSNVVAHGKAGVYSSDRFNGLDSRILKKYFTSYGGDQSNSGSYVANDEIKKFITFNRLNLLSEWPMKGKFDVI
ncbi:MAG: protein-glutamate O-methyltransferase CheR, partial [Pseudomonadales bacterium]|nr:protein-glutamate O-methyltransferase CheR [Pseudomonadales bacterium]